MKRTPVRTAIEAAPDSQAVSLAMVSHNEVTRYIEPLNPQVRKLARAVHEILDGPDCTSYVKTIYIGYEIGGQMFAALYAHSDHLEIALALPEDAEGTLLIDATHLTWKTLPVAAVVSSLDDLAEFRMLANSATERVRSESHDVARDNQFFIEARRERSEPDAKQKHKPLPRLTT